MATGERRSRKHSAPAATPNTWGGKREGAGRPATSQLVSHLTRPAIEKRRCPLQITLKLRSNLPSLQEPAIFTAFEKAAARARRFGVRIIHYTVLPKSILMICEAKKSEELERSFKSLNTTLAIAIKKAVKERDQAPHQGPVFLGRYRLKVLTQPDEVKVALRETLEPALENFDARAPFLSSVILFEKWKDLRGDGTLPAPLAEFATNETAREIPIRITATPQFWLNQAGWLRSTV